MSLESAGEIFSVKKLKEKLEKRYPNYNFDIPPEPDRKCKAPILCNNKDKVTYTDSEGNLYCGQRYKLVDERNQYKWEWRTCHALLREAKQGIKPSELPF
tara:strand:- start:282 stop:581 length:300 start_codon:yes stop_codon:yes gene_type:complete